MTAFAYLAILIINSTVQHQSQNNWREQDGVYELFGNTLESFLDLHPLALILMYDDSEKSQEIVKMLPQLEAKMAERDVSVTIGKMRKIDGPRWGYFWNVGKLPHLRFCIGSSVSVTTRAYPSIENIVEWVASIYKNKARITLVDSMKVKEQFNQEANAFYLRYNPEKVNHVDLLSKLQMVEHRMRIYYAVNPAFDVFNNFNGDDVVVGFRRSFEDPVKFMSSPNKLDTENILRFFQSFNEPATTELTKELLQQILSQKIRTAFYFGSDKRSKILEAFNYMAFEQKPNFLFVVVSSIDLLGEELREQMGLKNNWESQIRIMEFDGSVFRFYNFDADNLVKISEQFDFFNANKFKEMSTGETTKEQTAVESDL